MVDRITVFIARWIQWWLEGIVRRLIHVRLNRRSMMVGRVVERSVVQTVDRITVFITRLTQWWLEGIVGRLINVTLNRRCMMVGRVVPHLKGRRMKGCTV